MILAPCWMLHIPASARPVLLRLGSVTVTDHFVSSLVARLARIRLLGNPKGRGREGGRGRRVYAGSSVSTYPLS
uniref:Putative secreted protein n=1 Tax=Anopheles darlingi TaxID=43151 RepID=A0A2M4DHV5_ANODA